MFTVVDMNRCPTVVPSHFGEFTFMAWRSTQKVQRKQPENNSPIEKRSGYFFMFSGGPLTRLPTRSTSTSTRSAILMKGMPLFIP